MNKPVFIILMGVILGIILGIMPGIMADETFDSSIAMGGADVSIMKSYTDYTGVSNGTITRYEQYIYAVGQQGLEYENSGSFSDFHNVAVSTNLSGNRAEKSGIGAVNFIENTGNGIYNGSVSCCVFGIHGSGNDLIVASDVRLQALSIDTLFALEAIKGEVGVGYTKQSDNITVHGKHYIRGDEVLIAGQESCMKYPAGPADNGKPEYCVFQGEGIGYPIFTPRNGHGPVNEG